MRELVERYECITVHSSSAEINATASGALATFTVDAVARTAGTPRTAVQLPVQWIAQLSFVGSDWRVTDVETRERVLARQLADAPHSHRLEMVSAHPHIDQLELFRELTAVAVDMPNDAGIPSSPMPRN